MNRHDGSRWARQAHYDRGEPACEACRTGRGAIDRGEVSAPPPVDRVSTLGPRRRIRALQVIGWHPARLAHALGYATAEDLLATVDARTMPAPAAQRVRELYDLLHMTPATGPTAGPTRAAARAAMYAPPLAWVDIDDPCEPPHKARWRGTRPDVADPIVVERIVQLAEVPEFVAKVDREAVVLAWEASGKTLRSLGELTGWNVARVKRDALAAAAAEQPSAPVGGTDLGCAS